jgi:hypothetical protein
MFKNLVEATFELYPGPNSLKGWAKKYPWAKKRLEHVREESL